MEAASRKSGRVEKEKEGPPESLLAFYFLMFCFSLLFFYKETYERPDSTLESFPFFLSFPKLVFLETDTKIKQDMIFPSFELSCLFCFFPRILLYFWGEGRLGTHSVLPELHYSTVLT